MGFQICAELLILLGDSVLEQIKSAHKVHTQVK